MRRDLSLFVLLVMLLAAVLSACAPEPAPNDTGLSAITAAPGSGPGADMSTPVVTLPTPTATPALPSCEPGLVDLLRSQVPPYVPYDPGAAFVSVDGDRLVVEGLPFTVRGVHYYPRDFPRERFLRSMRLADVQFELELMQRAGLNLLRVDLRHDALFTCPGDGAVPRPDNLSSLDAFIQAAAAADFRLILVLNVDADLARYPLYDMPGHVRAQMTYLAKRYADEAAVMAYDLRDSGDRDYGAGPWPEAVVLGWLADAAVLVRQAAPRQLVTAGWSNAAFVTADVVDFVSFQHSGELEPLRQEIANLKAATAKPILLASIGYDSATQDELGQRQSYYRAFEAVERNALVGWVVAAAFDHPLPLLCPPEEPGCLVDEAEARSGLWNTSYFPKRALDAVRLAAGLITVEDLDGSR
ncbi:MAG: hypothetical protein ACOCYT_03425 [Chloroflexota bacterium]